MNGFPRAGDAHRGPGILQQPLTGVIRPVVPATEVVLGGVAAILQKLYNIQQRLGMLSSTLQDSVDLRATMSLVLQDRNRKRFGKVNAALLEIFVISMQRAALIRPPVFPFLGAANVWPSGLRERMCRGAVSRRARR